MTGKQRMSRILQHQPVDRVAIYERFWSDTQTSWAKTGKISETIRPACHFGFDMDEAYCFDMVADLDYEPQVIGETEDTITYLDGNGATLKTHKHHDATPEHIDFHVKDRETWERDLKPKLTADPRRIDFELYRTVRDQCAEDDRFFVMSTLQVFECMHRVCGHENLLMGMILDPKWVADMAMTYARLILELQEMLFTQEGAPDGLWYYEDMGYKGSPFFSPDMYKDLIFPAHKLVFDAAKERNLPIILHSCGFVEPLLPGLIEAGINCLEAMEVKAGMELVHLHSLYGDKISFMGGLDVRVLCTNDRLQIDHLLQSTLPKVMQGYNYIVQTDHSVPSSVEYDTYQYFVDESLRLGTYR